MKHRKKLIWQLYPSYLLLVLIALLATGWFASRSMRTFYMSQTREDLVNEAHLLIEQFQPLLNPLKQSVLDQRCKRIGRLVPTRVTIIQPDGTVLGDSRAAPAKMENHGDRPEIITALNREVGASIRFSETLGQHMMYVALPILASDAIQGVMRVAITIDAIDAQMQSLQVKMALGAIIIAALASIVCLVISRRISRPIEVMRRGAARYASGDLSHRLQSPDTMELADLAEAINQMAHDLQLRISAVINQRNETQAVFASMAEGVVALDRQERIINLNDAAARLMNRPKEQLEGRGIQEIIRNRDLNRMVQITLVDGTTSEGDITLYQTGEQVLSTHCTPLFDAGGDRIGAVLVLNDVTQLRRLENMRSDFAANVSHEIKTPLTAIQGFVETLHQQRVDDPEEADRFLAIIQKHVHRLTAIINDLLQLSRLEQDEATFRLRMVPGKVIEVLRSASQMCGAQAKQKGIAITIDCDTALETTMDADLMEQAVINLLDNAIKYSSADSQVTVSCRKSDEEIEIRVADEGMGIARKHLPRLFERFYRVDKARSRKMGGTGLGLAIVKHILQAHGGRTSVTSTQGRGSCFSLFLPLNPAKPQTPPSN